MITTGNVTFLHITEKLSNNTINSQSNGNFSNKNMRNMDTLTAFRNDRVALVLKRAKK